MWGFDSILDISSMLTISVREQNNQIVFTLGGGLSYQTCDSLKESVMPYLHSGEYANISYDLEQLEFIDSSGIALLCILKDIRIEDGLFARLTGNLINSSVFRRIKSPVALYLGRTTSRTVRPQPTQEIYPRMVSVAGY